MLNKVILIGRLGADPEVRYAPNGQPVATFRVATTWHNVVVFGKLAEICGEHLNKGRLVFVKGYLQTRSYEDREGIRRYVRYVTEIVAQEIVFLDGKSSSREE